jgi:hypothetical protein
VIRPDVLTACCLIDRGGSLVERAKVESPVEPAIRAPNLLEIQALVTYAIETGTAAALAAEVHLLARAFEQDPMKPGLESELLKSYGLLVECTQPVHGRLLLETAAAGPFFRLLMGVVSTLLLVAVGNEVAQGWFAEQPTPEEGWAALLVQLQVHILEPLMPLTWGALGASVYLLKTIYDYAEARQFDRTKLHGWFLRIVLGGVLAMVALLIFRPQSFSEEAIPLEANAIAFFVGLGVKVFYGALERTIEVLSEKIKVGANRRRREGKGVIREGGSEDGRPESHSNGADL